MKQEDWQELLTELRGVEVEVPLHQQALRHRLLDMYPYQHGSQADKTKLVPVRISTISKRILLVGVLTVVAGMLMLGLLVLLPHAKDAPNKRLVAEAPTAVDGLVSGKTAEASPAYSSQRPRPQNSSASSSAKSAVIAATEPTGSTGSSAGSEASPPPPASTPPTPPADPTSPSETPVVITTPDQEPPVIVVAVKVNPGKGHNKDKKNQPDPPGLALGLRGLLPVN